MLLLSRCVCLGFIDETHGDGKRSLAAAGDVDEAPALIPRAVCHPAQVSLQAAMREQLRSLELL